MVCELGVEILLWLGSVIAAQASMSMSMSIVLDTHSFKGN